MLDGGDIRHGRGQAFWRRGADGWSVSLNNDRGTWFDHRDGTGGGKLKLIQHVRGGSKAEARRWLANMCGIVLDSTPLSQVDKRRYTQARQDAPTLRREAEIWFIERREELEQAKADALAREDLVALEAAAREHYRLSRLRADGVAIVREYLHAQQDAPEHTSALMQEGEHWRNVSKALVNLVIVRWAREAGPLESAE